MQKIVSGKKHILVYKWQCILFGIATFLVPFHVGHQSLNLPYLGSKLSIYPIVIGLCFFYIKFSKKSNVTFQSIL